MTDTFEAQVIEVQALAVVDDVENRVWPPLAHAVLNGRQIGGRVEERAVLLLDDHRHFAAFEKDADGAVAFAGESLCREVCDNAS